MKKSAITEIESQFAQLPPATQLQVLERLVHHVSARLVSDQDEWEVGLAAMAADPEMQKELLCFDADFGSTEADGLGQNGWPSVAAKSISSISIPFKESVI